MAFTSFGHGKAPDGGYRKISLGKIIFGIILFIITTAYATTEVGFLYSFLGNIFIYGGIIYLQVSGEE